VQARLAEASQAWLQEVDRTIHIQLKALQEREAAQAAKAKNEVVDLRAQLELFLSIDAAATARCLSCHDRRLQMTNQVVQGSDGKFYQQHNRATASPVGGGHTAGAEKLPSVQLRGAHKPGTKASMMGGAGAPLHNLRMHSMLRMEDPPGLLSKGVGRAASVGALGSGDGHLNVSTP